MFDVTNVINLLFFKKDVAAAL
jgi:hypothetical protein